ncbi:MAG TPA: WYL domain-containing protein [bacterium]|nr:WYL domain-containing protein [bacterium]
MKNQSRGNLERILFIHRRIKERGFVRTSEIIEKFEVNNRTVQRDVSYMKCFLQAPLVYSFQHHAYRYEKPFDMLNYTDEKTMVLSAFLRDLLNKRCYVPFFSENILDAVEKCIGEELQPISQRISYALPEEELFLNSETIETVILSMRNKTIIQIDYIDENGRKSTRDIEPQHILNYSGKWYLISYCHKAKSLRTFMISRITSLKIMTELFSQIIEADEIERFISEGFGIFKSSNTETVTIRFRYPVNQMISRQKWHPKQRINSGTDNNGEYLDLSLPVADYQEILDRVFYYSPYAEALNPESFRSEWIKRIEQLHEKIKDH